MALAFVTFVVKSLLKHYYRNLSFGLTTKVRACEGTGQVWALESHFMLSRVQESAREWTLTLPNELPFWELESQVSLEYSEGDCKGKKLLDWKVPYIIGKLLERRCLKCVCMTHLDI
jgi:hypothetical protein